MRPKLFGIGLSKTGTSSLREALVLLGYRVLGPSKRLLREVRSGDLRGVIACAQEYDAFEDFPYPLVFRELHRHYGRHARFVLTRRRTADVWYDSLCDHARTSRLFSSQRLTYGHYRPFGRKPQYVSFYERHNQAVRDYFSAHDAADLLLEVCWDEGDGWNELCGFLDIPAPEFLFPRANRSEPKKFRGRRAVNVVVEAVYGSIAARASRTGDPLAKLPGAT